MRCRSMITNERQYRITQTQAVKFRDALIAPPVEGLPPKAQKAMRDGVRSQLAELKEQLAQYEASRTGSADTQGAITSRLGK
jgi:hypothetical protein